MIIHHYSIVKSPPNQPFFTISRRTLNAAPLEITGDDVRGPGSECDQKYVSPLVQIAQLLMTFYDTYSLGCGLVVVGVAFETGKTWVTGIATAGRFDRIDTGWTARPFHRQLRSSLVVWRSPEHSTSASCKNTFNFNTYFGKSKLRLCSVYASQSMPAELWGGWSCKYL